MSDGVIIAILGILATVVGSVVTYVLGGRQKTNAEVKQIEGKAKKEDVEADLLITDLELKQHETDVLTMPEDQDFKVIKQAYIKQSEIRKLIEAHQKLLVVYGTAVESVELLRSDLSIAVETAKRTEGLRDYFESKLKSTESEWLKTITELKTAQAEKDGYKLKAEQYDKLEARVKKLEETLRENGIAFDHIT